ncbi:MBL fold metallo-hydrolase [Allokutzneria albata]|uniref:L-ascorbate metabolism protein UlaG, beta-lactamase superfamily n=1 Tax=Allokutzneria albata TaxID=211114 RepID=A0A1G9ZIN7_ALLAB|nr:MBL fold metallo-hydrolase [Allokutzneria albata]SDN20436.1 L-ascorbate metabolism protein UlaG, beta-lactamase superfamily [Allokutzneria albata]
MRITHHRHACVLLETGSTRLLLDPGAFSSGFDALTELDAILVTHQHADHLDLDRLPGLLAANPRAELVVDQGSAAALTGLGVTPKVVTPGETITLGGVRVDVVGGDHATIYGELPGIPNLGYVIGDGAFYHPGDALFVPDQDIDVLGMPTEAPWLKLAETVDFMNAVGPRVAVPIHEALLARPELYYGWFDRLSAEKTEFRALKPAEATEL